MRGNGFGWVQRLVALPWLAAIQIASAAPAAPLVYSFDDLADGSALTTQLADLSFARATVLKSHLSLNEFEFPPLSGDGVVYDDGGAIGIGFAAPVYKVGAWFTHAVTLTIQSYDSGNILLGTRTSRVGSNLALSGEPAGSANEWLWIADRQQRIARVVITGDAAGGSFTMDDLTVYPISPVPETATLALMLGGLCFGGLVGGGGGGSRPRRAAAGLLLMLGLGAAGAAQAITVATPTASIDRVAAGATTAVTLSVVIPDASYIAGSANLQRLNADGSVQSVIGLLHDDGLGGDAVAGDKTYSLSLSLTEASAGSVSFQVSAAYTGQLKRLVSAPVSLTVFGFDLGGSGAVTRTGLAASYLLSTATDPGALTDFSAYALPAAAAQPTQNFQGTLTLSNTATSGGFSEVTDTYNYTGAADTTRKHLPPFAFQFIQTGSHVFPLERGSIASTHPEWEYILAPGRVWNENGDGGYSRAAIPFALQQKNANCVHNGVLSFLFKSDGSISKVSYQIASETCSYFKVNLWGVLSATYTPQTIADAATRIAVFQSELMYRMPTKTLAELATDYPAAGIDVSKIAAPNGTSATHITTVGFITGGVHYTGACTTRYGDYPYCTSLILPTYSTAKSMFASTAMLRLEQKYPGTKNLTIKSYVPGCNTSAWNNVTLDNTLDMATGNYSSAGYEVDEGGAAISNNFFLKLLASEKISFGCTGYAHKLNPGTAWVYHTSDTYVAGTMMQAYYRGLEGSTKDLYTDLVGGELWSALKTSPTSLYTRRTYDSTAQPFAGWGLIMLPDDVAKIASFIGINHGAIGGVQKLDLTELNAALQRTSTDRGLAPLTDYKYNNGYWAYNVKTSMGCAADAYVPFMSGSGGISVLLMQNSTVYYQFSDNNTYYWLDVATQSNKIRTLCN
jgi:hypothetical protein